LIKSNTYQKGYLRYEKANPLTGPPISTELVFQFNPAELTISKRVNWVASGGDANSDEGGTPAYFYKDKQTVTLADGTSKEMEVTKYSPGTSGTQPGKNAPTLEFKGGEAATYSLELFFDTTDQNPAGLFKSNRDVRRYTNDLLGLTLAKESSGTTGQTNDVVPPPPVRFYWGEFSLFTAVVESVEITFTMFDPDGTPVRAIAQTGFVEWVEEAKGQNPTTRTEPRKTWIVQQGQTLHQIAQAEYGHPSHWRHLADSNDLLNPLKLEPGQVLILPPLS